MVFRVLQVDNNVTIYVAHTLLMVAQNAQVLESNSVLCKVLAGETFFLIRYIWFFCSYGSALYMLRNTRPR